MVRSFLLTLLVTGLLIGGKAGAWLFPFSLSPSSFFVFRFFFTFLRLCVVMCVEYRGSRVKPVFPLSKGMINSRHPSIDILNARLWRIK